MAAVTDQNYLDSNYSWLRLAASLLVGTIGSVGMWIVVVVLPYVQVEFESDRSTASLPYTTTMIGVAIGSVVIGRYVDRVGIVLPLIVSAIISALGFVLAAYSTSIWMFAILQGAFVGMAAAVSLGPMIADVSHWFNRRLGIAVAVTASGNYLAGAIWPTILQQFIDDVGWRGVYIGLGIFSIVTIVPLALLLRRRVPVGTAGRVDATGSHPGIRSPKSLDLSPRNLQILLVFAGFCCCVAMSMPQVHIVAYCADLGFGVARGAEMLSIMLASGIISRLATGFLADYIGGVKTLLLGSILQCLALFLYMPFDGLASLYIVSLVFGLSQGGIVPSYAIIVREYLPAAEAGERVGLVMMATIVGMAFGGWLSGWIYDLTGSYQAAFINGIAWNIANAAIIVTVLLKTKKHSAEPA
jgi:MFS family permease